MLLTLFLLLLVAVAWVESLQIGAWAKYVSHAMMIVAALGGMLIWRRAPANYGLTTHELGFATAVGFSGAVPLIAVPLLAEAQFGELTLNQRVVEHWASAVLYQVVFVAAGEELLFRGLFQSELNEIWGRRYRIGQISFGPALIAASLLFGTAHWLDAFNQFLGQLSLNWPMLLFTSISGLILGLARELTGSLVAPVILHIAANVYFTNFANFTAGRIGAGIGWGVCAVVSFWWGSYWSSSDADSPDSAES